VIATLLLLLGMLTGKDDLKALTDRELVHRTARGNSAAFEVLHRRYYHKLYKVAYVKLGNEDDAHDITSEAFVRAVKNVYKLDPLESASLYPWLHTVVANLVVDHYRRNAQIDTVSDTPDAEDLLSIFERIEDPGPRPEDVVSRRQVQDAIRQALDSLPEAQAEAVYYRFIGQMSLAEIGAEIGKSEGAVKSLLHRGMLNLRARVQAMQELRRQQTKGGRNTDVNGDSVSIHR